MVGSEPDVEVGRYRIPAAALSWTFGPSGGPGGQHANRSNTRAELRFDLARSPVFSEATREWMIGRLGGRAVDGVVVVVADESRSQWRNRALARRRLAEWLEEAMKRPTTRRTTRPTRASQDERVAHKRARSEVKKLRRPPEPD